LVIRKIVHINEELCNGCGLCIPSCTEGALQIVDGKARLVKDDYCDGLGACLGRCPQKAISIAERDAQAFDGKAVHLHLAGQRSLGSTVQFVQSSDTKLQRDQSALTQWPVQLNLVPVEAPFYNDRELLIVADCVPVAYPNLHSQLLSGRSVVIGCPKFDDARGCAEKLGEILKRNNVKSITVAHMEVPCCSGLAWIVDKAMAAAEEQVPVNRYVITTKGELK
jgi:Fe-S-cluster-containing hydrogenase component 2